MFYYYLASFILLIVSLILIIIMMMKNKINKHVIIKPRDYKNYAILIPARYESKVIRGLLDSLKTQVDSMKDTYIIVESESDETVEIAKNYGATIFIRGDITNRKRKGYALDEVIKEILKNKHYDLYFIFDADNILDKSFISNMLETYNKWYDIATGYRNIKNNLNWVTTCSGLTFSMINTLINRAKTKLNKTIIISGTGYYISGELIEKWQGFPFSTLTEDYELSLYATANNISTFYNENAIFFDEQPTEFKVSITQRTRWVKGFFEARKLHLKNIKNDIGKIIGVTPYILIIIGAILAIVVSFSKLVFDIINNESSYYIYLIYFFSIVLIIYSFLAIFTAYMLKLEKNKLNVSIRLRKKAILLNPIFLLSYIVCLIKAITTKVSWERIDHGK